mmetsp:Transcript_5564/g.11339  ORF Transcript_5564/g.11339 Transcript_5564/m.11339 type:complete len:91 (-) Transcript_5564:92-364(-)
MVAGWLRNAPVKLGHLQLGLDFSVLSNAEPLLLLGMDQMRRFGCVVDLDQQRLIFAGEHEGASVPFLSGLSPHVGAPSGPSGVQDACTVS